MDREEVAGHLTEELRDLDPQTMRHHLEGPASTSSAFAHTSTSSLEVIGSSRLGCRNWQRTWLLYPWSSPMNSKNRSLRGRQRHACFVRPVSCLRRGAPSLERHRGHHVAVIAPDPGVGADRGDGHAGSGEHVIDPHQRGQRVMELRPRHLEGPSRGRPPRRSCPRRGWTESPCSPTSS